MSFRAGLSDRFSLENALKIVDFGRFRADEWVKKCAIEALKLTVAHWSCTARLLPYTEVHFSQIARPEPHLRLDAVQDGPGRFKTGQNGLEWSRISQNGPRLSTAARISTDSRFPGLLSRPNSTFECQEGL